MPARRVKSKPNVSSAPSSLLVPLLPHQQEFIRQFAGSSIVCNAGEPGVGKTLMAFAWLRARNAQRTLWLTIAPYLGGTKEEIRTRTTQRVLDSLEDTGPGIYPMTYGDLRRHRSALALQAGSFDAVVADESQALKRIQAKQTRAAVGALTVIHNRMIMSGSLITNELMDIWSQFLFLDRGDTLGRSYVAFRERYYRPNGPFAWAPHPWALGRIKDLIAPKTFWCRKEDCLRLPPVVRRRIPVDLHPKVRIMYDQLVEEFATSLPTGQTIDTKYVVAKIMRLCQMVSGAFVADDGTTTQLPCTKRETFKALLHLILSKTSKVVVWCRFVFEAEQICAIARSMGVQALEVFGSVEPTAAIAAFQTTLERAVLVATLAKGAKAITLTAAAAVVYYNRDSSVDRRLQSVDRTYRIGSERHDKVEYWDMYTRATVEELQLNGLLEDLVQAVRAREPRAIRNYLGVGVT